MIERRVSIYFRKKLAVRSAFDMTRIQITGGDAKLAAKWARITIKRHRLIGWKDRLARRLSLWWKPVPLVGG